MHNIPHVMTKEAAEAYRAKFRKDTEKAGAGRFQHFKDEATKQAHLEGVKRDQQNGTTPF